MLILCMKNTIISFEQSCGMCSLRSVIIILLKQNASTIMNYVLVFKLVRYSCSRGVKGLSILW